MPIKDAVDGEPKYKDVSKAIKKNEGGTVDWVYVNKNDGGYKICKVRVRNSRVPGTGDKFSCLLPDTLVMTDSGWKKIIDITTKDNVAILENDNISYENPSEIHNYDFDGKMYELKSQQVDLTVTPNHRMWIRKRYGRDGRYKNNFEFLTAKDVFGKRVKYKKNVENFTPKEWIGRTFTIPEYIENTKERKIREEIIVDMKDWLKFFGIWIAEGWVDNTNVMIAANKKRVRDALDECITNMGFKIYKSKDKKYGICNVQLANYMKQFSVGAVNKFLPNWVWNLDKEQCKILLQGLELGDGYHSKSNTRLYFTSSKTLAWDVSRLCIHAGYSFNCRVHKGKEASSEATMKDGRIIRSNADNYCITVIKKKVQPEINHSHKNTQNGQSEKWVDYKGTVHCLTVRTGVFMVCQNGKPVWTGNSRHGQKGTIGLTYGEEDMPYSADGVRPDIIVNSSIPSRMTVGHLIECVSGKIGSTLGKDMDATPFTDVSVDKLGEILQKECGFSNTGKEILYCGKTGRMMEANIFMGPTFYYKLKHMVQDKIHSRSSGPYQLLTRQPAEGRSRDGGLRFGEMERDCMLSHGTVQFLKERLFDSSDKYQFHLCKKSGLIAVANSQKNIYKSLYDKKNTTEFAKVQIPYASKLFFQELMSMSIAPRIFTDK